MEYCKNTLSDYIKSPNNPVWACLDNDVTTPEHNETWKRWYRLSVIMLHISSGMDFIHEHGEVHRDLKPENGLLACCYADSAVLFSGGRHPCFKIADFGYTSEGSSTRVIASAGSRGTWGYRAPELLREGNATYTRKVDIWAMGCIFFETATRQKAFKGDIEVLLEYTGPEYLKIPPLDFHCDVCSPFFADILSRTLSKSPTARSTAYFLLSQFSLLGDHLKTGSPWYEDEVKIKFEGQSSKSPNVPALTNLAPVPKNDEHTPNPTAGPFRSRTMNTMLSILPPSTHFLFPRISGNSSNSISTPASPSPTANLSGDTDSPNLEKKLSSLKRKASNSAFRPVSPRISRVPSSPSGILASPPNPENSQKRKCASCWRQEIEVWKVALLKILTGL